jgi:hypothetical protein
MLSRLVITMATIFRMQRTIASSFLPPHPGHSLCYTLRFTIPAGQEESPGGICVQCVFFPPAVTWEFIPSGSAGFPPHFQGNPNSSGVSPDASPICFDIVNPHYVKGDANGDQSVDIDDIVFMLSYIALFGPAPTPLESGDANCDGALDIDDLVYLVMFAFASGPAPW